MLNFTFSILNSQFSIYVYIIPNLAGMFNEIRTFLKKIYSMLDSGCSILETIFIAEDAVLLAIKMHKMLKRQQKNDK
jgi:hypothetical protein